MKDSAEQPTIESKSRLSRAKVSGAVVVTAVVLVVLALFVSSKIREPGAPQPLVVTLTPSEQATVSPRLPPSERPEASRTVSPPEPAPGPQAPRSSAESSEAPVGIHAFPPLGTRPKLTGIIVPDDFELPPGYVRHYQSSDDGERLAPILMFDPVQPPLDEFGQPMDIPPDRIVPPELAPAGLPIIMLELPEAPESDPRSLRGLFR